MSVIKNANGPKLHRLKKDVIAIFHNEGLKVLIDTNLTTTDFLDVTLELFTGKSNNSLVYVNANSNHPPNILEQLPKMVKKWLSSLSINEDAFNKARAVYEKAKKSRGFYKNLKFGSIQEEPSRNRKRKLVCFIQPYSPEVTTNIGKYFLELVWKHFHKHHRYKKIINSNTIKLSYSCIPIVKNIIKEQNNSIMKSGINTNKKDCNCRSKDNCPVGRKCLVECMGYEATVSTTSLNNT